MPARNSNRIVQTASDKSNCLPVLSQEEEWCSGCYCWSSLVGLSLLMERYCSGCSAASVQHHSTMINNSNYCRPIAIAVWCVTAISKFVRNTFESGLYLATAELESIIIILQSILKHYRSPLSIINLMLARLPVYGSAWMFHPPSRWGCTATSCCYLCMLCYV